MDALSRYADKLSLLIASIAGVGLIGSMAMVVVDVVLRMFGGYLTATYELTVNYAMLLMTFLPLMRLEWMEQMVTVDAFYDQVGARGKWLFSLVAAFLTTVVYLALAWVTWAEAVARYEMGSYVVARSLVIPVWPAYFLIPLGFGLACLVVPVRFLSRQR